MAPGPEVLPPLLKQLREKAASLDLSETSTNALVTYARTRSVHERKGIVALIETYEKNAAFASSKDQLGKLKAEVTPALAESALHVAGEAKDVAVDAAKEAKDAIVQHAPVIGTAAMKRLNSAKAALAWFGVPMLKKAWSKVGARDGVFANVWQFFKALFTTAAVGTGGVLLVNASKNLADRIRGRTTDEKKPADTPEKDPVAAGKPPAKEEKPADASGFTRFEDVKSGSLFNRKVGFDAGGKRMLVTFIKSGDDILLEREDPATGAKKKFRVSADVVELDGVKQEPSKPGDTGKTEVVAIEKKGGALSLTSKYTNDKALLYKGPYFTDLAFDARSIGQAMNELAKDAVPTVQYDLSGRVKTTDAPGFSGYKNGSAVKCRFIFS